MRESILETLIGAVVVVVAGAFLWFALARGGDAAPAASDTVEIGARFSSAKGIEAGTEVSLAGVKVGTVRKVKLDTERAEALVTMALSKQLMPIEDGMSARVQTEGLLGGNYISLEPGSGFSEIKPCGPDQELFGDSGCGEILYTQGSVDLLTLFASFTNGGGSEEGGQTSTPEPSDGAEADGDESVSEEGGASDSPTQEDTDSDTESSESSTSFGEPYPGTSSGDDQ